MADCKGGLTMLIFNEFDPDTIIGKLASPDAKPAKPANPAKAPPLTLAGLATLAGIRGATHYICIYNSKPRKFKLQHTSGRLPAFGRFLH